MRKKIFYFIAIKIFKRREGEKMNKVLWTLNWILFPIETYVLNNQRYNYDIYRRILIIDGIEYSKGLFEFFGREFRYIPQNSIIAFIKNQDGIITFERLS